MFNSHPGMEKTMSVMDEEFTEELNQKWSGLLEGLPRRTRQERHTRNVTAIIFENQMQHLRKLQEATSSANIGSYTKSIFPVLRRTLPNLIANEIASVQPLTGPVGLVFYKDTVYGSNKGATTAGNIMPRDFDKDYSSEFVNGEICATGNGAAYGGVGTALNVNLAFRPVRPLNTAFGFSVVIKELNVTTGAVVQTATDNGTGGFTGNVSAGTINYSNGSVSGFLFTNAPANTNPVKAYYFYDGEMNTQIPSMSLDIKSKMVQATPRRIKALWSSEAAEDLQNLHGISAEQELTMDTAAEMALEIDREIVQDMFQNSTGTTGTFDRVPPAGINELDHLRAMITQMSTISGLIHKKTLRAPANFIVTSVEISALLTQFLTNADYRGVFSSNPDNPWGPVDSPRPRTAHGQFSIYKAGVLNEKWTVYVDPFFTRDQMMFGLKGDSYLDSGYAWAPYIPLQITSAFLDPNDLGYRKAFRTRYGKALLRSEFFGQMRVLNL